MSFLYPILSQRSSDLLVQRRLLSQLQADQLDLLRIQTQISTGRRVLLPSDSPLSAARGINVQRILEEKQQSRTNIDTSRSFLAATDNALSTVSKLINEAKSVAIGAAQSTISDSQRATYAQQIQQSIVQLLNAGNYSFRGRHLFAGSQTSANPFNQLGDYIAFSGDETLLRSYLDDEQLLASNLTASEVFGAISSDVRGNRDMNPILTRDTRLADLRGGLGITLGAIQISDGTYGQIVDLSSAKTIDDVLRLIERNPPAGRKLTARINDFGLSIDIDDAGGGNLNITEVGNGTTAAELGIYNRLGTGTSPIVGQDLNPQLVATTLVDDILGTHAKAYIASAGTNNDLVVTTRKNGTNWNGVKIQFVDDSLLQAGPAVTAGNETASYSATPVAARAALKLYGLNNNLVLTAQTPGSTMNDIRIDIVNAGSIGNNATVSYNSGTRVLTLGIDSSGATTTQALMNSINFHGTFSAAYDGTDPSDGGFLAAASVPISNTGTSRGNTGRSGGDAKTLFVNIAPGKSTAKNIVDAINNTPAVSDLFIAELDPSDSTTTSLAGRGLIDPQVIAQTSGGTGESIDLQSGLQITNGDTTTTVDLSSARTIEDILNLINRSGAYVTASVNASGNGIDIRSTLSGADFYVGENGGTTATQLGIRSLHANTSLSELNHGRGVETTAGTAFQIQRTDGVTVNIDLAGTLTIQDVLDRINAAGGLNAQLASVGNGIVIEDTIGGASPLVITKNGNHQAAWDLGLVPVSQRQATGTGVPPAIRGSDTNPHEVEGVFNSFQRLYEALQTNNQTEIERAAAMLEVDLDRLLFGRSDVGARQQGLDAVTQRIEDEEVELNTVLTKEIDADLAETITNLASRQASLQASLQLTSKVYKLSLLDFL